MSSTHDAIIDHILNWSRDHFDTDQNTIFLTDSTPGHDDFDRPRKLVNSRPDFYMRDILGSKFTVIGEAKARNDRDKAHLKEQVEDYLGFISRDKNRWFVFCAEEPVLSIGRSIIKSKLQDYRTVSESRVVILEYQLI